MAAKHTSKWGSLAERVAQLNDGESIVLESDGDLISEASKIRAGLRGRRACILVRRTVRVVDGKIVITRVGTWPAMNELRITTIPWLSSCS